jgi:hypothetical protein
VVDRKELHNQDGHPSASFEVSSSISLASREKVSPDGVWDRDKRIAE